MYGFNYADIGKGTYCQRPISHSICRENSARLLLASCQTAMQFLHMAARAGILEMLWIPRSTGLWGGPAPTTCSQILCTCAAGDENTALSTGTGTLLPPHCDLPAGTQQCNTCTGMSAPGSAASSQLCSYPAVAPPAAECSAAFLGSCTLNSKSPEELFLGSVQGRPFYFVSSLPALFSSCKGDSEGKECQV